MWDVPSYSKYSGQSFGMVITGERKHQSQPVSEDPNSGTDEGITNDFCGRTVHPSVNSVSEIFLDRSGITTHEFGKQRQFDTVQLPNNPVYYTEIPMRQKTAYQDPL
jgi:hypothetical protein